MQHQNKASTKSFNSSKPTTEVSERKHYRHYSKPSLCALSSHIASPVSVTDTITVRPLIVRQAVFLIPLQ